MKQLDTFDGSKSLRLSRALTFTLVMSATCAFGMVACGDDEGGSGGAAGSAPVGGEDAGGKPPQTGGANSVAGSSSPGGKSPVAGNGGVGGNTSTAGNAGTGGDAGMGGDTTMGGDAGMGGVGGTGGDGDGGVGGETSVGGDGNGGMGGDPSVGGAGMGGMAGKGGMGGGANQCNPQPGSKAGDGINTTIDELDDNNIMFPTAGVGAGSWDFSKDQSSGTISPASTMLLTPVDGGQQGKGLHVSGTGLKGWGAALAAILNGAVGSFDASSYGGVAFYIKGTSHVFEGANKVMVLARMPDLLPGVGSCCKDSPEPTGLECYSSHRVVIDVPEDWQEVKIAWDDFQKSTWGLGSTLDLNPNRIRDIVFSFNRDPNPQADPTSFDVWVDGLRFLAKGEQGNVGQ